MGQTSQLDQLFVRFPDASPEDVADSVWLVALGVIREPGVTTPPPADPSGDSGKAPAEKGTNDSATTDEKGTDSTQGTQGKSGGGTKPPVNQPTPDPTRGELLAPATDSKSLAAGSTASRQSGEALRVPGGSPLPGATQIARALRPFRRRVPSRHLLTLDIDATVRQIASRDIWHPVLRPSRARWFEIALVAEWSNSMALWTETIRAFRRVLERLGGFRDVRLWWIEKPATGSVILRSKPGSSPRSPRELVSPDGRRIVLFATDCLSTGWRQEAFGPLLKELGRRQPVALLQMLPRTWWGRTALAHADPVFVGSKCPGAPNQALSHEPADPLAAARSRLSTEADNQQRVVPIPILTSEPELVAEWARLVCKGTKPSLPGVTFAATPSADRASENAGATTGPPTAPTAEQRWKRFTGLASPTAIRFARLLAATHLRMPIVRLIQTALLPESDQTHLAEVFLGGIVRRVSPPDVVDPDRVQYAFHDGVAERLRTNTPLDQMFDVHSLVSKYIENRYGAALHLEAILRTGEAPEIGADFEERSEFASVTADVLRRFGARYAGVASKLAPSNSTAADGTKGTGAAKHVSKPDARSEDRSAGNAATDTPGTKPIVATPEEETLESIEAQLAALEGFRILWVDAEPARILWHVDQLRNSGVAVTIRNDSRSALDVFRQSTFDAIISDLTHGDDVWAGLHFLEQVRSIDTAIPFVIFDPTASIGMSELSEKSILTSSNDFGVVRRALAETLRTISQNDDDTLFSNNIKARLRQYLQYYDISRRFAAEESSVEDLFLIESSKFQWELLWAELWRQSDSASVAWGRVLGFIEIATSASSVVISRIVGPERQEIAKLTNWARTNPTQPQRSTSSPDASGEVVSIDVPIHWIDRESTETVGVLTIERSVTGAYSPQLAAWLQNLADSLARRLVAPTPNADPQIADRQTNRFLIALSALDRLDQTSRTLILVRSAYRLFQRLPRFDESQSLLMKAVRLIEIAESKCLVTVNSEFAHEARRTASSWKNALSQMQLDPNEGHFRLASWLASISILASESSSIDWIEDFGPDFASFIRAQFADLVINEEWLVAFEEDLSTASRPTQVPPTN